MWIVFFVGCSPTIKSEPVPPVVVAKPVKEPKPLPAIEKPLADEGPSVVIPSGSTGVAVVDEAGLRITMPLNPEINHQLWTLYEAAKPGADPRKVELPSVALKDLVVFDETGKRGELPPMALKPVFWCENDGGIQWRLEGTAPFPDASSLKAVEGTEGIVAFVRTGSVSGPAPQHSYPNATTRRTGDLDGDGKPDARLAHYPNTEGADQSISDCFSVVTAGQEAPLRCCGP